jgi:fatty acid desaturase
VNYHLEHHFIAAVPVYKLRKFHEILKSRNFFDGFDCINHGYLEVIRKCTKREESSSAPTLQAA